MKSTLPGWWQEGHLGGPHCGLCPFHSPAEAAAPLIRPQRTERPFSHQLPLATQSFAVKSGQRPRTWPPERLTGEGASEVSATSLPELWQKGWGSCGEGVQEVGVRRGPLGCCHLSQGQALTQHPPSSP